MRILGIESSCDETAAAIVEDGRYLLSNVVNSQIDIHSLYGGVIPEVASRSHLEVVIPVVEEALKEANSTWNDIDAIGVTYAPGLVGSLLIGTLAARTLAYLKKKPLYAVHHVEGHVYANFLLQPSTNKEEVVTIDQHLQPKNDKATKPLLVPGAKPLSHGDSFLHFPSSQPAFPILALIVSGGHSQLVLFRDHGNYELLGQTQDDAVGEAFDKVAKIIGLPYPGGPSVSKAAQLGDDHAFTFPKAQMQNPYDFSFSGLKTAVLRRVQAECGVGYDFPSFKLAERLDEATRNNIAASFQRIAIETLVDKAEKAFRDYSPASVVIAGGVAANQELRKQLSDRLPIEIQYADPKLCTDNAAMIATLAYYMAQHVTPVDPLSLEVVPSLSMTATSWAS